MVLFGLILAFVGFIGGCILWLSFDNIVEVIAPIVGIIFMIIGIVITGIYNKPNTTKPETVVIKNKKVTIESCQKDEFCKVKKIQASQICTAEGCKIIKSTISEIKEDF